eukprot:247965-Pelagomonas_calceolata.AAC.6
MCLTFGGRQGHCLVLVSPFCNLFPNLALLNSRGKSKRAYISPYWEVKDLLVEFDNMQAAGRRRHDASYRTYLLSSCVHVVFSAGSVARTSKQKKQCRARGTRSGNA